MGGSWGDFEGFWGTFWKVLRSMLDGFGVGFRGPRRFDKTWILKGSCTSPLAETHTAVTYIAPPRGASEPRSGAARYRLRRTRAPDSLSLPIFLQAASRGASEPRSGAARYRPRRSRAPDSVHLPIYCHSSPVRKKTTDIRKVQLHMNKNALPVPLPSQVLEPFCGSARYLGPKRILAGVCEDFYAIF